jgi:drug/metabolite transporter (DMT)-like permease
VTRHLLSPPMLRSMPDGDRTLGTPDRTTLAAFVLSVVLAGGNAVAIRYISCETCELDPFWGAATRFLTASVVFAMIAVAIRAPAPRGRALLGAVLYGGLQFGGGFGLFYWGLVRAPAGLGQVLLASVPLLTFGLAIAQRQEGFRWEGLVGAVLAIGGIAVVFSSGADAGVPLTSMLAILLGAGCFAEALIVVKSFPPVHPAAINAVGMGVGAVALLALALTFGEGVVIPERGSTWIAQAYLVIAGSIGVFSLYVFVVRRWTASAASYQLVLIPLVTVIVAAWLHDEQISWAFAAGSILVLIGVYFGALRRPSAQRERAAGHVRTSPHTNTR